MLKPETIETLQASKELAEVEAYAHGVAQAESMITDNPDYARLCELFEDSEAWHNDTDGEVTPPAYIDYQPYRHGLETQVADGFFKAVEALYYEFQEVSA